MVVATNKGPTPQELADLVTEGINAVIDTQQSYARDWYRMVHKQEPNPANRPAGLTVQP
jgi:hypothetical protein